MHLIGQLGRRGAEKQLTCLSTALKRRGWQQSVVSFNRGDNGEDLLRQAGIEVFNISRHRFRPWRFWQLLRFVRRRRPAILLSWSAHVAVYAQWLRGVGGPKRVFNLREDLLREDAAGSRKIDLRPIRRMVEGADFLVSNSQRNVEALRQYGVRLPPSQLIYNIVQSGGRARAGEAVASPRIVAAGSLVPGKAFDVLLRALGQLMAGGTAFELSIAGDGPERAPLEQLTSQLGLGAHVRFLGEVSDVPALLAQSHILAHPTRSEGLSNVVLEAMAEGLPVVTTPAAATSEISEDGRTSLIVPFGSTDAMAGALGRLLSDPEMRGRLGAAGLRSVSHCCNEAVVADRYEQVFQALIGPIDA
ncbi:MAG: glycosyltransferase [Thermoguttaceae bacterium]